jgi:serine protease
MLMYRLPIVRGLAPALLGILIAAPLSLRAFDSNGQGEDGQGGDGGGSKTIEAGQPPVSLHATVGGAADARQKSQKFGRHGGGSNNLAYRGGIGGIGVETAPKVILVFWGAQWNNNDPSGEAAILQSFYSNVGASSWLNSVTQYCQGVSPGTTVCNGGTHAGNPAGLLGKVWYDNASNAPVHPTQAQLAGEAINAAAHFGMTTSSSNASVQYVIATATQNNMNGFGTSWCAWHSATSSQYGNIAYTNLPYMTDAGGACGAYFNGLGPNAGITIVGGHEMAETITDQFPNGGWLDGSGEENGDKCAWISTGVQGASATITTPTNLTFPVQSLWSNAFNSGAGGCVLSYP